MALATIPFTILIDVFAIKDGSWWVETIFPYRLLNGIPIEDFIWCAVWFYFIVATYETFIDRSKNHPDSPPSSHARSLLLGWFTAGAVFLFFYPLLSLLSIPYFYAFFALFLGFVPLVVFLFHYPHLWKKFTMVGVYMFFVNILHEISALSTVQWYFPGSHFIGWVQIFSFRFPFEEFML